ncbi:hypothetical protein CDAR_202201 [Caerostris darwini]|uniref:Uncharacterized protein n=1 Tax=Caerostris darwini TaxID=1538125 RepID=A0AAV4RN04_9ARAC|nr:hypothetical protein CDAR_202201 [Caerostris darwini]
MFERLPCSFPSDDLFVHPPGTRTHQPLPPGDATSFTPLTTLGHGHPHPPACDIPAVWGRKKIGCRTSPTPQKKMQQQCCEGAGAVGEGGLLTSPHPREE